MADERISNEPIDEVLKAVQSDVGEIKSRVGNIETEVGIVRQHIAALVQSDMQRGSQIMDLETRIRRIESRLDLREADA